MLDVDKHVEMNVMTKTIKNTRVYSGSAPESGNNLRPLELLLI